MTKLNGHAFSLAVALALSCVDLGLASAQTNQSISLGANIGTLNYTLKTSTGTCQGFKYNIDHYYNFVFNSVSSVGISQPLGQDAWFYYLNGRYSQYCTTGGVGFTYAGKGYTIVVNPNPGGPNSTITIPGYVNPKYIVLGVIYAAPGSKSYVDYLNSNLVSSTVTTKNSYASSYKESNAIITTSSIFAWKNGSLDTSAKASSSYTQSTTTTDATAVTVQKTTSNDVKVSGPVCDYCGVDHDYDLIAVWVNPVRLYTLTNGGIVQPNGYGFSTFDQPGTDVWYVYAGELNGDTAMRTSTANEFARAWAGSSNGFQYASGDGPALTAQEEQNILKFDPYFNCTYKSPINDAVDCPEPPDSTRFTQSTNASFPYQQPIPGGQPIQKTYSWSYTNTDTQGVDVSVTDSQTYALESTFSGKIFGYGYQATHSQEWTNSYTYETSSQFTNSNTSTSTASITGPACNDVGGACSPMYPPPNAYTPFTCTALSLATSFGQGDNMYIYQDNLFGTFLVEPYGQ
ncbi:MAG TPA: hypothetical protein VGS27_18890 [Candidatus Sulfotelmatobacter sp.]|nr:hypothetical protein [Candidatus Sulfotelmatobacter sp.]